MLAITMGDPNGIGPEITARLLQNSGYSDVVVIGNPEALKPWGKFKQKIIDPFGKLKEFGQGRETAQNGLASYAYVKKAVELALAKEISAIVTAPLNKEALHLGGINKDGHTEILAELCKAQDFGMMFASQKLNIMLTTIHKALKDVPSLITKDKLRKTILLAFRGLNELGYKKPSVGVCGLNPHAGEKGLFGREELDVIIPVIKEFQEKDLNIQGPYPADTLFTSQRLKQFDLIIAHYHDQGLIPLKMLAFDSAVNITVGLPIVRTSVDHGTAYDIVGQGKADLNSLREAVRLARVLVKNRNNDK